VGSIELEAVVTGRRRWNSAVFFEMARYSFMVVGTFLAYLLGSARPEGTLRWMNLLLLLPLTGLTGIEGMFFGAASAASMARQANPEYQRQSAGANLAFAATLLVVFFTGWGNKAEATIMVASLLFFVFSAIVHAWGAAGGNRNRKNWMRAILTLVLLGACAYPLIGSVG
jgi:hypothetical protein